MNIVFIPQNKEDPSRTFCQHYEKIEHHHYQLGFHISEPSIQVSQIAQQQQRVHKSPY